MNIISFFKSKPFWVHIGLAILCTFLLIWIATQSLKIITQHSNEITVPDLSGMSLEELETILSDRSLSYEIIDSIYNSTAKKGTVSSQDPLPDAKVKSGRTIYITVVSKLPEQTTMPDLKDLTLRQAIAVLETYGLKAGKLKYVPDIAKNAILKQLYKGSEIKPGTIIVKNSSIDLVLGRGEKNERASLPFLLGKKRKDALRLINENALNVGIETFEDGADSINGRVYKQSPAFSKNTEISLGSTVDLWYKSEKKFNFNAFLKKFKNDTIEDEN